MRLLRGEPVDNLSRELGVEIYRLEEWRRKALLGMEEALRERIGDPLNTDSTPSASAIILAKRATASPPWSRSVNRCKRISARSPKMPPEV